MLYNKHGFTIFVRLVLVFSLSEILSLYKRNCNLQHHFKIALQFRKIQVGT